MNPFLSSTKSPYFFYPESSTRFFQPSFFIFVVVFIFLLAGCSGSEQTQKKEVVSISLSPSPLVIAGVGVKYQLTLSGKLNSGADAETLSGVVWASSDSSKASVDSSGTVTARALGEVNIVADYFGVKDTVNVKIVEAASFSVFPANLKMTALNQQITMRYVATDNENTSIIKLGGLTWQSSDDRIASVDGAGVVTTHAVGSVIISATYKSLTDVSNVSIDETGDVISGAARYEDKQYSSLGFTGAYNFKPIRYATIELLDEAGHVLMSSSTDEAGTYALGYLIPDVYSVRLLAEVKAAPAAGFSVRDMQGAIYSYLASSAAGQRVYPFDLSRASTAAGVFNLLDVTTSSAEFADLVLLTEVSDLAIYWEKGYRLGGTYYCTGYDNVNCFKDKGIYIISVTPSGVGPLDTDEFDDDVIMHEFSHYLTENYSVDDSLGGAHTITQNDSDLRLSWSEGWGIFFPSAVKYWLGASNVSSQAPVTTYIDTVGDNEAFLSFDIETGEIEDGFYYASSELAVSRILWNVMQTFDMQKIWDVLVNYFPLRDKPTSLPLFWDGLLASDLYSGSELTLLEAIFEERRVIYREDTSESDDSISTATSQAVDYVPVETNTIYSDGLNEDVDFFSFTAQADKNYSVLTTELYNGIDTLIRLYDAGGNLLEENDDADATLYYFYDQAIFEYRVRNDSTAMASKINFTATYSGEYFVEVRNADKQLSEFDFVGHYGSYKLVVNRNN